MSSTVVTQCYTVVSRCDPLLKGLSMRSTRWESKQLASSLVPSLPPRFSSSSFRGVSNLFTMAAVIRGIVARSPRGTSHITAMATPRRAETVGWVVGTGIYITRQGFTADVWSGRITREKENRMGVVPIRAMGDETMWITASSAVALVIALAGFAALGGFLLSMGVDNEERVEVEKIEKLKEKGLYENPEPTQYGDQGVTTRTRKRRISED